jgi:hypothetical protein
MEGLVISTEDRFRGVLRPSSSHQTHQYQTHHQTHHQSQHYGPLLTTRRIAYVSAYTTPELIGVVVSMP